jgi:hypothetical protein
MIELQWQYRLGIAPIVDAQSITNRKNVQGATLD